MAAALRPLAALLLAASSAGALAQTPRPDPIFSHQFESGVVALRPNLSETYVGATNEPTYPLPLTVHLDAVVANDTFVPLASSDPMRLQVAGGGTTVFAGESSASVRVNALAAGPPVTVSANVGNAVAAGVRAETYANETDTAAEADFCNLQFPSSMSASVGDPLPTMYGRLFEAGATEAPGPPAGWIAEAGIGPAGSDPRNLAGWRFRDASYNVQIGNDDEFQANLAAPGVPGNYVYTFRMSPDGGATWTYCDLDGAGSNAGLTFNFNAINLGQLTVSPLAAHLVINEVDYDQPGTDTSEFIEIFNGSGASRSLAGLAVVLVNGNGSVEYARIDLAPYGALAAGQYLVIASPGVFVPDDAIRVDMPATPLVQNGAPDGVALVDVSASVLIDALSYEGSITAATIVGFPSTVNLVEGTATGAADSDTMAGALARFPNGTDTDNANADWHFSATPSPGAPNN